MTAAFSLDDLARVHRLTRHQYEQMAAAGVLREDARVELLYGVIVDMSPQGSDHGWSTRRLGRLLDRQLDDRAVVSVQFPFRAGDWSEPEPDLAVIPPAEDRPEAHAAHAHLLVEVSQTTLRTDLGPKARLYAELGVPQYWVVDLAARCVHEHTDPREDGYATVAVRRPGDVLAVAAFPDVTVAVDEILPPVP